MITITYRDDGQKRQLTVEGHAGYAERGKDIICAAASTLMMSLQDAMRDSDVPFDEVIGDGYAQFTCDDSRARDWFYMAVRGFLTLAGMYPDYYRVTTE